MTNQSWRKPFKCIIQIDTAVEQGVSCNFTVTENGIRVYLSTIRMKTIGNYMQWLDCAEAASSYRSIPALCCLNSIFGFHESDQCFFFTVKLNCAQRSCRICVVMILQCTGTRSQQLQHKTNEWKLKMLIAMN